MALSDTSPESLLYALRELVRDIRDLITESEGVTGLHKNGDIAPWEDLLPGGRYGEWLHAMTRAEMEIARADLPEKVTS